VPIRVLIVDDQPLQREGFRMVLESQRGISVVGEAGDGAEALAAVQQLRTDVVLMDVRMPGVDGYVAAQLIRTDPHVLSRGVPPRIVLVTALDFDEQLPLAAAAGAFALIYKDAKPDALIDTVRSAAESTASD
jgi:DNA-binding NarL/FixJ family response regulator